MKKPVFPLFLGVAAAGLAVAAMPVKTYAWGDEGHMIVALIADDRLAPSTKQRVGALLQLDEDTLTDKDIASRSTWADRYRDSDKMTTRVRYNATQHWHFVDIEIDAPDVDAPCFGHPQIPLGKLASEGPAEACVTDKIDQFWKELKDRSLPQSERIIALKYLLHLVGDVHQPLHSADNHDHGGNCEQVVTAAGVRKSLHSFWDFDVVTAIGIDRSQVALALASEITPAEASSWSSIAPM